MNIEVKKIKHARSLSEETNAFSAELHVDGKHVADCKNSGQGGMTDVYPKYSENKTKRKYYFDMVLKAEEFCKTLPKYKGDLKMSLDFYIDLEVEKDLQKGDIDKTIKKIDKECLKSIVILSQKQFNDFVAGKTLELKQKMYGWKRPLAELPVDLLKQQLPAIKAKLIGDEFIYNKNLPK